MSGIDIKRSTLKNRKPEENIQIKLPNYSKLIFTDPRSVQENTHKHRRDCEIIHKGTNLEHEVKFIVRGNKLGKDCRSEIRRFAAHKPTRIRKYIMKPTLKARSTCCEVFSWQGTQCSTPSLPAVEMESSIRNIEFRQYHASSFYLKGFMSLQTIDR